MGTPVLRASCPLLLDNTNSDLVAPRGQALTALAACAVAHPQASLLSRPQVEASHASAPGAPRSRTNHPMATVQVWLPRRPSIHEEIRPPCRHGTALRVVWYGTTPLDVSRQREPASMPVNAESATYTSAQPCLLHFPGLKPQCRDIRLKGSSAARGGAGNHPAVSLARPQALISCGVVRDHTRAPSGWPLCTGVSAVQATPIDKRGDLVASPAWSHRTVHWGVVRDHTHHAVRHGGN